MSPDDPRHGTRPGYYAHRREGEDACLPCKSAAAKAEQNRQLRLLKGQPGRIDATGTARRLQALVWLGYDWVRLGREIGSDEVMVKRWAERTSDGAYVFRDTAERVAAVYDRLSMVVPEGHDRATRNAISRARGRARRNGWHPPLAWDDIDCDDEPACLRYLPASRADAIRDLADLGVGITEACRRLHLSRDAVERYCQRNGLRAEYERLAKVERVGDNQYVREAS